MGQEALGKERSSLQGCTWKKPLTYVAWTCCRFMGIAEQMGRVLQRTSISVNIKERLDFSCALFGPDGSLVANAPHLPVHLGAMSEAIRYQVCHCAAPYFVRKSVQDASEK